VTPSKGPMITLFSSKSKKKIRDGSQNDMFSKGTGLKKLARSVLFELENPFEACFDSRPFHVTEYVRNPFEAGFDRRPCGF